LEILRLFNEDGNLTRIKNKSGFLAGIMRRYSSSLSSSNDAPADPLQVESISIEPNNSTEDISRRERKKKEQMEIQAILEEEGVLDEMEGKQVSLVWWIL
jgi:hypothetical protein